MTHSRTRRWSRLAVASTAVLAAGALALSGCATGGGGGTGGSDGASSSQGTPVKGGTLTVAIGSDPGGLDENAAASVEAVNISELIFEKLFALDADNKAHPMLVDHYKMSKDRLTYDFTLRKGITFSDGTPLTSTDAVESLKYWEKVNSTGKKVQQDTASMKTTGDLSFQIVLKSPRYPFLQELAGVGAAIIKGDLAKTLTQKGFTPKQAVGTGPYMLKAYKTNDEVVLVKNPHYTSRTDKPSGYAGAKHAYLKELDFKVVGDPDALMNGLKTGQWQYTMGVPVDQYTEFKNNQSFVTHTLSGGNLDVLELNTYPGYSIFAKQKARDALNMAIDKKALNAASGGSPDITVDSGALVNKERKLLYSTSGKSQYDAYNPQKAKKLFKEAGYTDSKPIKILTSGSFPAFKQWSTIIQSQLEKIGIKVDIQAYDFVTMLSVWEDPSKWDMVPIFFNGDFPSPGQMDVFGSSHSDKTAKHPELPDTRPKAIPEDLDKYLLVTNDKEAHQVMNDLTKTFWDWKGTIILGMTKPYAVYSPKLKGYDNYWYVFWNSWLAE